MGFIFWMSTGTFSAEHTSRFIVPALHFLFPSLALQDLYLFHGWIRKFGHLSEYFILGLLFFRAFRGQASPKWRLRWTIYSMFAIIAFALGDELHQSWVASRTSSLVDAAIDSLGGLLSQIAIYIQIKITRQRNPRRSPSFVPRKSP
jgi:VanZ family protein